VHAGNRKPYYPHDTKTILHHLPCKINSENGAMNTEQEQNCRFFVNHGF